jgi:hypothetical protein
MTFIATVVRVFIASPSDTTAARSLLRDVIQDWNSLHAEGTGVMLLPIMWERDATPEIGTRPQEIVNKQLVANSDMLIGVFWTRLGTPTGKAESGTVEEIEQFIRDGRRAIIYFSQEPVVPESIDFREYERLNQFRRGLQERGLLDGYQTPEELWRKLSAALTRVIWEDFKVQPQGGPSAKSGPGAQLVVRIEYYSTTHRMVSAPVPGEPIKDNVYSDLTPILVIKNAGTASAEDLTFRFESESGNPPGISGNDEVVRRLPPKGSLSYGISNAEARQFDIVMNWTEEGRQRSETQTLRM